MIAFGAVLASCGSSTPQPKINSFQVERGIANSILGQRHVSAIVSCPANVPREAGRSFTCTARLDAGKYSINVVQSDGKGHVRWKSAAPLVILSIGRVERSITSSIRVQRNLSSMVKCPVQVLQAVGVQFKCTATVAGRRYPFTVTELDGRGHVRYVGR